MTAIWAVNGMHEIMDCDSILASLGDAGSDQARDICDLVRILV